MQFDVEDARHFVSMVSNSGPKHVDRRPSDCPSVHLLACLLPFQSAEKPVEPFGTDCVFKQFKLEFLTV